MSEKIKLISDSDYYWNKVWNRLSKAKKRIYIITYDMDNKMVANITLNKLIEYVYVYIYIYII